MFDFCLLLSERKFDLISKTIYSSLNAVFDDKLDSLFLFIKSLRGKPVLPFVQLAETFFSSKEIVTRKLR